MATDSIGSVSVDIRGDYSKLQADFAAAQGLAAKAGAGIASSLTTGMAPAAAQAGVVLDKFGNAFKGVAAGATAATPPVLNLNAGVQRLIIAQEMLRVAYGVTTPAIEAQGAAMGHSVSQIQAVSGALRTFEGNQGIRAAERFLTLIPGLASALQFAFPVIGAIALFEVIGRVTDRVTGLKEAEDALKSSTQAADEAFAHFQETANRFTVEHITEQFSRARGIAAQGAFDKAKLKEDQEALHDLTTQLAILQKAQATPMRIAMSFAPGVGKDFAKAEADRLKKIQQDIRAVTADILADQAKVDKTGEEQPRTAKQESGALQSERIANQKRAGDKASELLKSQLLEQAKLEHDGQMQRIAGLASEYDRVVQTGQEELRYAKDKQTKLNAIALGNLDRAQKETGQKFSAESQGRSTEEVAKLRIKAQGELADAQAAYKKETVETQNAVSDAVSKGSLSIIELNQRVAESLKTLANEGWDRLTKSADESERAVTKAAEASLATTAKVMEIEAKGKGQTDAAAIDKQKLQAQLTYIQQLSHTRAQEVAFAQSQAGFDTAARNAKIAGLNEELAIAKKIADDDLRNVEVARIQGQIAEQEAKGKNDTLAALIRQTELEERLNDAYQARRTIAQAIADWNHISLDTVRLQVAQAAVRVPGAVGGAVAGAVFDGHKGQSIGTEVAQAMKGIGKQLLGEVLTAALDKMLAELIAHTALQAAMNALVPAQTAAMLTGQAAVVTTPIVSAIGASAGAGAAGGAAGGIGGAVGGIAGGASSAATGFAGPIIAALGGIIGGVISGVMSLIGAHQIVNAIHGTTAAVLSLKGTAGTTTNGLPVSVTNMPAPQSTTGQQGGFLSQSAIFGSGGLSITGLLQGITTGQMPKTGIPGSSDIVAAVNRTTEAVKALGGAPAGTGTAVPALAKTGFDLTKLITTFGQVDQNQSGSSGLGGLSGGNIFGQSGALSESNPLPVTIVGGSLPGMSSLTGTGSSGMGGWLGKLFGGGFLTGFAEGGHPPVGVASIFGEKGPELWIPDQAGTVIPAGKWGGMSMGLPNISGVSSSSSQSIGELHVHAHGITNPKEFVRQVARELPNYLKHTSPVYSPASR